MHPDFPRKGTERSYEALLREGGALRQQPDRGTSGDAATSYNPTPTSQAIRVSVHRVQIRFTFFCHPLRDTITRKLFIRD